MSYKIAIGGIHIESSTFTSYVSSKKDFKIKKGKDIISLYPWLDDIDEEIEIIPLIYARAIPGGKVSTNFYNKWYEEFFSLLKKENNIDGILFDIHGAMSIEGVLDPEGIICEDIRKIVGKDTVISATMDLHGNVSDKLFNSSDLLTCFRTAPHIDADETRKRAFANMLKVIKEGKNNLFKHKVDIPMLLPGEKTSTEVEPGKSIYKYLDILCKNKEILDASIWMGFPWADQPRCHAAVVVTGYNSKIVEDKANEIAEKIWKSRNKFKFVGPTASTEEAIERALKSNKKPFFISDTGDNPGAGGSGDTNIILKKFLNINKKDKINKKVLIASIYDNESIMKLYDNEIDSKVLINLGAKVDKIYGKPLKIKVKIERFFKSFNTGKSALVSVDNIYIIITEKRYQYGTKKAFKNIGVKKFNDFDIIVVKMGYLEPELSNASEAWVMALSKGCVTQDIKNIKYDNIERPMYPLDKFNDFT